jgi:hypothetical protein
MPIAWTCKFGMPLSLNVGGTTLNDIQNVSYSVGRVWQTDPYGGSVCQIRSRNIAAWTTAPKIGDMIYVSPETGSGFVGYIKDVQIEYGIVASMDEALITVETVLGLLGRTQLTAQALTQKNTTTQAEDVAIAAGVGANVDPMATGKSTASAQTYTGNVLDVINNLMTTEIGHVAETSGKKDSIGNSLPLARLYPRNYYNTPSFVFSDNPSASTELKYDAIAFTSAAQNYYTKATIQPEFVATQSAGSGIYQLTQTSLDYSTGQALSHAQYLISQYNSTSSKPFQISASYSNQGTDATRQATYKSFLDVAFSGQLGEITFRSNNYYVVIEGLSVAADVSDTSLTVTFSAYDNNNYLILNDAVFGTLGTSGTYPGNKLGF